MSFERTEDARLQEIWAQVNPDRIPSLTDLAESRAMADQTVAMLSEPLAAPLSNKLDAKFAATDLGQRRMTDLLKAHRKSRNDGFAEYIGPDDAPVKFDHHSPAQVAGVKFLIFANNPDKAHVISAGYTVEDARNITPIYECYVQATESCNGFGDFDLKIERAQYMAIFACCCSCKNWIGAA